MTRVLTTGYRRRDFLQFTGQPAVPRCLHFRNGTAFRCCTTRQAPRRLKSPRSGPGISAAHLARCG